MTISTAPPSRIMHCPRSMQAASSGATSAMRRVASNSARCDTALKALLKSSSVRAQGTPAAAHFVSIFHGRTTAGSTPVSPYW